MSTMLTFSVFSVIFLAIGIVLQVMSDRIIEIDFRYDDVCEIKQPDPSVRPAEPTEWCKKSPQSFEDIEI